MILKNHVTIEKFMLESQKYPSGLIDYVTKNMERKLVEAMLDKIEHGKDYLIRLHDADFYEDFSRDMCGYKMALEIDGWTPCSERLPRPDEFVLVSGEINGVTRPLISRGCDLHYWSADITGLAWMPLPEPYKENADG